ncbi:MAG TPA: gamma-glutamyl-gamma-aminobutyrate hydrolase family protein, partial [Chitinophagaceae bacterium]|nr:gamma-glutamyl-gamma-aminobutyrate hydrolase family protein [Chitinophagaceae bacterium]
MKIGLTYTGDNEKHQNYINWLKSNDDISIVVLSEEESNVDQLKDCDGLVLSGGLDIYPSFYGNKTTNYPNSPKEFQKRRDEFEMAAFQYMQEKNKPVLGVCRGLQLINCIYNGSLKQDIGEDSNKIHKAVVENKIQKDKAHGVDVERGTLLHAILQADRLVVNSAHHQSIDQLGKGLKINCYSDDGLIEGFEREHTDEKPFLLAVQWHPERMYKFNMEDSPVSKAIRNRFIEEVKKSITKAK